MFLCSEWIFVLLLFLYIVLNYVTFPYVTKLLPFTLCISGQSCRLWYKLPSWAFYNSKSSRPNKSANPFKRGGLYTLRQVLPSIPSQSIEHFVILEHFEMSILRLLYKSRSLSFLQPSIISGPVNYLKIFEPFAIVNCFEIGKLDQNLWALCDRQVLRDHQVLHNRQVSQTIGNLEAVKYLDTLEIGKYVKAPKPSKMSKYSNIAEISSAYITTAK